MLREWHPRGYQSLPLVLSQPNESDTSVAWKPNKQKQSVPSTLYLLLAKRGANQAIMPDPCFKRLALPYPCLSIPSVNVTAAFLGIPNAFRCPEQSKVPTLVAVIQGAAKPNSQAWLEHRPDIQHLSYGTGPRFYRGRWFHDLTCPALEWLATTSCFRNPESCPLGN